jgi:hypothetical protein
MRFARHPIPLQTHTNSALRFKIQEEPFFIIIEATIIDTTVATM